jgi:hypothetical protein
MDAGRNSPMDAERSEAPNSTEGRPPVSGDGHGPLAGAVSGAGIFAYAHNATVEAPERDRDELRTIIAG